MLFRAFSPVLCIGKGTMSEKEKILIADDSAMNRAILTEMLGDGYEILEAENGRQAVSIMQTNVDIDLLLLDIMMPDMDGYSVCKQIREISQVPIILITAKGEDYERVMGLDIGADDYIVKPFSPNEVMARVRAVLRRMGRGEEEKEKNKQQECGKYRVPAVFV